MSFLEDSKKLFSEGASENTATLANGRGAAERVFSPPTPASAANVANGTEKVSHSSRVHEAIPRKHKNRGLPSEIVQALHLVLRDLLTECVHFYRADAEDLATMSHDELKTVVKDYLARQVWYEAGVTAAPQPHQPIQLTGTHRHHWMVDGEAVSFAEPVAEGEAHGRWTTTGATAPTERTEQRALKS